MPSAEKVAAVTEITRRLDDARSVVLTDYRGLTVAQLAALRASLGSEAKFQVVKNTLTKIAVRQAGLEEQLAGLLTGPSAITFVTGDVVEAAKGLRDFSRDNPNLVIKGGVVEGKAVTPQEIIRLADLEPRDVLLARLAGAMTASLSRAAAVLDALPTRVAQLADALRAKREDQHGGHQESAGEASEAEQDGAS